MTLNDPLPTGTGISWSISLPSGLLDHANTLNCDFGDMGSGRIRVGARDEPDLVRELWGVPEHRNGNRDEPPGGASVESVTVNCPSLAITKVADAPQVSTGDLIGFTVTVSNCEAPGTGTATAVTLSDPLPAGAGVNWSIDPAYTGAGTCSITGSVPTQTLRCSFGDMAPGASNSVHIASATTAASAGTYENTATVAAYEPSAGERVGRQSGRLAPILSIAKTADARR